MIPKRHLFPSPQISKAGILSGDYASSTGATETESTTNTTSGSDSTEEYTKRMKGNSGVSATAQKMVEQYRDNIRAINREIIESETEELKERYLGLLAPLQQYEKDKQAQLFYTI